MTNAHTPSDLNGHRTDRQIWMSVLARASAEALREHLADGPPLPTHRRLKGPDTGLVMLRGQAGGDGTAFNLKEATVTRCTVSMGEVMGHATVLGRDLAQAELAAAIDAALQMPTLRDALMASVVEPLAAAQDCARAETARKAEATRVNFFTMATMR